MRKLLTWLGVVCLLAATLALYRRADVVFDLSARLWSCI